jgi:hypothetical protein
MTRKISHIDAIVGFVIVLALTGIMASQSVAHNYVEGARATSAHVLYMKDEGHLRLNQSKSAGQLLVEEGTLTGQFTANVTARFSITSNATVNIAVYPKGGGSISAQGSETVHFSNAYATFSGLATVTHGTGRYAHAYGKSRFYGVLNRKTNAVTLQTVGKLYY